MSPIPAYSRRDFYKICLITGRTNIYYADKRAELDDTFLFFANPHIPYSSGVLTPGQTGFACLFTEGLLKANDRSEPLQQSPLFKVDGTPFSSSTPSNGRASPAFTGRCWWSRMLTMCLSRMSSAATST